MARYDTLLETGEAALAAGNLKSARRAFEHAARIRLGDPVSRIFLAEACSQDGDLAAARDVMSDVLLLRPWDLGVISTLAKFERSLGNTERTVELARLSAETLKIQAKRRIEALLRAPSDIVAGVWGRVTGKWSDVATARLVRRARRATSERRFPEAETLLARAEKLAPDDPYVLQLRARLLLAIDASQDAVECLRKAVEARPDDSEIKVSLIEALIDNGLADEAMALLDRLPEPARSSRVARRAEAFALWSKGEMQQACERLSDLLAEETDGRVASVLGNVQAALGQFGDARQSFRTAAQLLPRNGYIYWMAMLSRCIEDGDELHKAAEHLRGDPEASQIDRALAELTLGRLLLKQSDGTAGFDQVRRANAMTAMEYDPEAKEAWIDSLIEAFPATAFDSPVRGGSGEGRVFIVGLPRSGSTLVEQVLASHPMVHGAGEPECLFRLIGDLERRGLYPGPAIADEDLDQIAETYVATVDGGPENLPVVTDKNLSNVHNLGLIALLFPKAKIVHCSRNIMDNGLSIFLNRLSNGFNYATDLRNIGHYYNQYRRLMRHWEKVLPIPIHHIRYEEFVADTEPQVRSLLDALGLPFDPACLKFYENTRAVYTTSLEQVRHPVYRSSVDASRNFEAQLAPLRQAILDGGEEVSAG